MTVDLSISVSPQSPSLQVFHTQQFSAAVKGVSNTAVTWEVSGKVGGNLTVGQIDSHGFYTAPDATPNPSTVTITATSQADKTQSASATLTILADAQPPSVVSVTPAANQTAVALDSTIQVQFSDALDPSTVNSSTFTLGTGTNSLPYSIKYDPSSFTVTMVPEQTFTPGTQYTVTISTSVTDPAGLALPAPSQWSFTTEPLIGTNGTVSVPSGTSPTTLTVVSYGGKESIPDSQGAFDASLSPLGHNLVAAMESGKSFGWLAIAEDLSQGTNATAVTQLKQALHSQAKVFQTQRPIYITHYQITASPMAASSPNSIAVNATTTAEALLFMSPYLHSSDPATAATIQAAIAANPGTATLAQALDAASVEQDPLSDSVVQSDLQAAIVSITQSLDSIVTSPASVTRKAARAQRAQNRPTQSTTQATASSSGPTIQTTPNCWNGTSSHITAVATGQLQCLDLEYLSIQAPDQPQNNAYDVTLQNRDCPGNIQPFLGLYWGCDVDWLAVVGPVNTQLVPQGGPSAIVPSQGSGEPESPLGDMLSCAPLDDQCKVLIIPGNSTFRSIDPRVGFGMIVRHDFSLPDSSTLAPSVIVPADTDGTYVLRGYSGGIGDSEELQELKDGEYGTYSKTLWNSALAVNIADIVLHDNIGTLLSSADSASVNNCAWKSIVSSGQVADLEQQLSTQQFDTLPDTLSSVGSDVNSLGADYKNAAVACGLDATIGSLWDYIAEATPITAAVNKALEGLSMLGDLGQHVYELWKVATPIETGIINVQQPTEATPTIVGMTPNPVTGLDGKQQVTIAGSGFQSGAIIQWQDITDPDNGSVTPESVTNSSITAEVNFTNQSATWKMQVVNPDGNASNWWSFQVTASTSAKPDLVPGQLTLNTNSVIPGSSVTVTFTIKNQGTAPAAASTTGFRLGTSATVWPGSSADLPNAFISTSALAAGQSTTQSQSLTIPSTTAPGTYYVWVVVDDATSSTLNQSNTTNDYAPSPALSVTAGQTAVPSPISPGTITDTGFVVSTLTPQMQWGGPGATTYELVISKAPYGAANIVYDNKSIPGTASSIVIPSGSLQDGTKYRWNMSATNAAGTSPWSEALYFTVNLSAVPAAPTLVGPGSSSSPGPTLSTLTPTFQWNAVSGATNYGLYVKDVATGALVFNNDAVGDVTSLVLPSGTLQAGHSYVWNMRASNSAGFSSFSTQLYFQEQASTAVPAAPTITGLSPASYASSNSNQLMTIDGTNFQSGATLTFYDPQDNQYVRSASFVSSTQLTHEFNDASDPGTWTVFVTNPDGQTSNAVSFSVQ